jgi:hypothetical protein
MKYSIRPIAFRPEWVEELGDMQTAVYFQQIFYWSDKGRLDDGWIYKTVEQFSYETTLSRKQQDRCRKILVEKGFIEVSIKKANGAPTLHYKITERANEYVPKGQIDMSQRDKSSYTESTTKKEESFFSLKETLGTAEGYKPDHHSPLDEKKRINSLAKKLGLKKVSPKVEFMYKVGNDFLKGYQYYTGVKYVGNVHLEPVARNLSLWFDEGETRETMQEMIDAFFEGDKGKKTTATPTAVFSPHTYNAWKQNKL